MLIPSLFTLVVLSFMLAVTSVAWLAMNKSVTSSGMQMSMDASPNLIIAKTSADVQATDAGATCAGNDYTITYDSGRSQMLASTLDWTVGTATGLKYVTNSVDVDFNSGYAKDGKTLTFAAVPASATSAYYVDFDAYIAADGKAMENVKLVAQLDAGTAAQTYPHLNAATVVLYKDSVSSSNKIGNPIAVKDQLTASVDISLPGNTVPLNTEGYIHIIARCYFDGALANGSGAAYVNSGEVTTDQISLNLTFTAQDIS